MLLRYMLVFCLLVAASLANAFQDPLHTPAKQDPRATEATFFAATNAGKRIIVVGQHGIILNSDSNGEQWTQADVPVSVDLVSVVFPTELKGWAVGHGGIVLHSVDGGQTWAKQLDGDEAGEIALAHYQGASASLSEEDGEPILFQAERLSEDGARQPFLDVWFMNDQVGFVVGTFNRLFGTKDGGESWVPLLEQIDNPDELHFFAIEGTGDDIYIAGERGGVWRWDHTEERFVRQSIPYEGTFFGVLAGPDSVVAYGMRGTVFRSSNRGESWEKIPTGLSAGISSGTVLANGQLILASHTGELVISKNSGVSFQRLPGGRQHPISGIVATENANMVVTDAVGVHVMGTLPTSTSSSQTKVVTQR